VAAAGGATRLRRMSPENVSSNSGFGRNALRTRPSYGGPGPRDPDPRSRTMRESRMGGQ
jgi:hypothetical protein